jgi:ribonucleoside-diphosphate reductase alpha chain
VVSRGLVRSKTDRLTLVNRTDAGTTPRAHGSEGALALKSELAHEDEPLSELGWTEPVKPVVGVAEKRAEARMKGYVGEACPECANFTLVRNGTCLKCETCGSTTGCS